MIVTAITVQQKDQTKRNIFIDGVFAFSLYAQDVAYFHIEEGKEIPKEQYDYIQKQLLYIRAQDTALQYIGYQMRTEYQIRQKLKQKEFSEDVIEAVITFLKKYHYCDDFVYAQNYIKQCLKLKPKSAYALQIELKQKGVSQDIITQALEILTPDEVSDAMTWILKKTRGNLNIDQKQKQKIFAFLQRKGYCYAVIIEAFAKVEHGKV